VLISGFLAGRAGTPVTRQTLASYYRRRLIRIYPPYLLALGVFTALGLSGAPFLPSALMLNMIVPPPPFTLWFMTMIVLFYLAAPFLLAIAIRPARLTGAIIAIWMILFTLDRLVLDIEDRLLVYLPAFAAGILIANHVVPRRLILAASALLAVIGYGISLNAPILDPDQSLWMALWATASAMFTFVALRGRMPRSRIVEEMSLGGFFLYLFHRPIYVVLLKVSGAQTPWTRELLLVFIGFPAAIVFGILAQRAYDAAIKAWWTAEKGSFRFRPLRNAAERHVGARAGTDRRQVAVNDKPTSPCRHGWLGPGEGDRHAPRCSRERARLRTRRRPHRELHGEKRRPCPRHANRAALRSGDHRPV